MATNRFVKSYRQLDGEEEVCNAPLKLLCFHRGNSSQGLSARFPSPSFFWTHRWAVWNINRWTRVARAGESAWSGVLEGGKWCWSFVGALVYGYVWKNSGGCGLNICNGARNTLEPLLARVSSTSKMGLQNIKAKATHASSSPLIQSPAGPLVPCCGSF